MRPSGISASIPSRQNRLRSLLAKKNLGYLLISHMPNVYYLTGFRGSAGMAVFGPDEAILFVDPRYTLQAEDQARGVEVRESKQRLLQAVGAWLKKRKTMELGFDESNLTCAAFRALQSAVGKRCQLRAAGGVVEDLRLIKDSYELGLIRKAARLTSETFEDIRETLRPGLSEADLAAEIEYRLKRKGAEGVAFETIVASGPRSALPHARASSKLLRKNEFVIFDLGAIISGYAADMTRTVYLGKPDARARRIYQAVLEAEEQGVLAARAGTRVGAVDATVRRALAKRRLSEYFTHSTGHGVGLEIHEGPRVARGETKRLKSGFVVTVEPGVYVEGYGGVRVEDTVAVGDDGPEVLTSAPKQDWIIS